MHTQRLARLQEVSNQMPQERRRGCQRQVLFRLCSDTISQKKLKEEAPGAMQQLMAPVQTTADLYNEMYDLGKFEQYYQQKLKEQIGLPVHRELKNQKKHAKSLKKKSLWPKSLEEIVATLVDIVHFYTCGTSDLSAIADHKRVLFYADAACELFGGCGCQQDEKSGHCFFFLLAVH
ncbi:protein PSK SIMULATOR 1-like isoform X2 [Zingiber officinale]|uniref:protein PSK SIMULATOR 1-like isoform X2 n=1 Tax=Zingiber officinale TaxID=94328 RepID=UPI001C4A99A4|nr:protein PSK SIMULATOR 1-like isoform X2 [Zingiber officinale]